MQASEIRSLHSVFIKAILEIEEIGTCRPLVCRLVNISLSVQIKGIVLEKSSEVQKVN